jgi:ABC-2 type transport system ATP-binding protein
MNAVETIDLIRFFKYKKKRSKKKEKPEDEHPGETRALDGVSLTVREGELFGLLGPNGAGKTTLIKILTTLLLPTSGQALVDGFDVVKDTQKIRERISMVAGGENAGYGILNVEENLWMFAQFYGVPTRVARPRIAELLKVVDLTKDAKTKIHALSTGMRQKMNFARGFVSDPKIAFLDEPTLGLDVNAARDIRGFIKTWVKQAGKTVLLTTHYMAEADELCDRMAIINKGLILACDTPRNLKKLVQKEAVFSLGLSGPFEHLDALRALPGVQKVASHKDAAKDSTTLKFILDEESVIAKVIDAISKDGSKLVSLTKTEPSLEDVFVQLVGKSMEEEEKTASEWGSETVEQL